MKLRHQIFIMLAIPVACQLCTVLVLFQAVSRVDQAAKEEQNAKEVISLCHQIDGLIGRAVLEKAGTVFNGQKHPVEQHLSSDLLKEKSGELRKAVSNNPQATEIANRLQEELARFLSNWSELGRAYVPGHDGLFFAEYFFNGEFIESQSVLYKQMYQDDCKLSDIYRPMTRELRPEATAARTNLMGAIAAAIVANLLFVAALAIVVNRQTLTRLNVLMDNIRLFAKGERTLKELQGRDELAELDQAFRDMSEAKFQLDEIQKSLRAMVAHDLRSPLTSIMLSMDIILEKQGPNFDEKTKRSLQRVASETQRLSRLANTLLDIEKLESGRIQVDLNATKCAEIMQSAVDAVRALADSKSLFIEVNVPQNLFVSCDKERTIQCGVNLLSNAIKFAPMESTITATVSATESGKGRFEIIDGGIGVPESDVRNLFSKFVQLQQPDAIKKEGSGLGLYICRLLIEAQDGTLGYERKADNKTCFWFELPLAGAELRLE